MSLYKQTTKDTTCNWLAQSLAVHFVFILWLHVILTLFLVEFSLFLGSRILVLLVLRDKIIHVGLSLCELHLVHSLTCVPMKEGLAAEHGCEELSHALEHL